MATSNVSISNDLKPLVFRCSKANTLAFCVKLTRPKRVSVDAILELIVNKGETDVLKEKQNKKGLFQSQSGGRVLSKKRTSRTRDGRNVPGCRIHLPKGLARQYNRIVLKNLHPSITQQRLHDICSQFGEVERCVMDVDRLMISRTSRKLARKQGPRTAAVVYHDESSARKAVESLNNKQIENLPIDVTLSIIPPRVSKQRSPGCRLKQRR